MNNPAHWPQMKNKGCKMTTSANINEMQTALFKELGVFFAFSNKQFEEQRQPGVDYCTVLDAGDCVPKSNAAEFAQRLSSLHKEFRKKQLTEKGIEKIIEEELVNHECFYTGEIDDAVEALAGYEVTYDAVEDVYRKVAHKYEHW